MRGLRMGLGLGRGQAGEAPSGLVTELTMGSVTYTFSAPVEAGLDQTGRAYVVDPGAGVTVTAISPAQTTSGADIINGAQKNLTITELQGLDERLVNWSAAQNDTGSISLVAGDKLIKVISSLEGTTSDRDGNIAQFACLHCVTNAPTANQVLGPTVTWAGDATPEVYNFNLNTFYAARSTKSAANITWPDFATLKARVGQFWPTFAARSTVAEYQYLSPRGFGGTAGAGDQVNYGLDIAQNIGDLMLVTTVAAGAQFTEAQIKEAILTTLMHGIEWGVPLAYYGSKRITVDGGHLQFHQGPSMFALKALGLDAKISDFLTDNPGSYAQAWQITSLTDFAPHVDRFKPWFSRERTLDTQPGGSTISLPFRIDGYGGAAGYDMRRDSGMPPATRIVRKTDGETVTTSAKFDVPDTTGNPVFLNVALTGTNTLTSGNVVTMLSPIDSPLQIGSYDWLLRGTEYPADFSPYFDAGYRNLQSWGGSLFAVLSHGVSDPLLDVVVGYFEVATLANYPSSTNNYPGMMTTAATGFYAENWDAAWSALTVPSAFVVGNWTLDASGNVSISALPDNGGAIITGIDYRLDGGSWVAATGINEFSVVNGATIDFTIASYAGEDVEIRASNAIGDSAASDVKSAVASGGITPTFLAGAVTPGEGSPNTVAKTLSLDLSAHNAADDIVVMVGAMMGTAGAFLSETAGNCTLDGNNASAFPANVPSVAATGACIAAIRFPAGSYAASSTLSLRPSANMFDYGVAAFAVPAGSTVELLTSQAETTRTDSTLSGNVDAGDGIMVAQLKINGVGSTYTYTGAAEDYAADARSNEWFTSGSAGNVAAATPRTITIAGGGDVLTAAISIVVKPAP